MRLRPPRHLRSHGPTVVLAQSGTYPVRSALRAGVITLILVSAGVLASASTPVVAFSGLVAQWTMDEGTGDTVTDSAGAVPGTMTGDVSWITSGAAQGTAALAFGGSTGQVTVAASTALEPSELTLTVWVRGDPANPPQPGAVIVEKGAYGCDGPSYGLYVDVSSLKLRYNSPLLGPQNRWVNWSLAVPNLWDGQWHLLAATIPSGYQSPKIGIDGYKGDTGTFIVGQAEPIRYTGASNSSLAIGAPVNPACGQPSFHGDIDDVRIWDNTAAFDAYVELMPLVATSLVLDAPGTVYSARIWHLHGSISPRPLAWDVVAKLYRTGAQTLVDQWGGSMDADGTLSFIGSPSPTPGTYDVVVTYPGAGPYLASTGRVVLEVLGNPTATELSIAPMSPIVTQSVILIAKVTSPAQPNSTAPAGEVTFIDSGSGQDVVLGTASQTFGASDFQLALPGGLSLGDHRITARYQGDTQYAGSESTSISLRIGQASSVVLLSGPATAQAHHAVTFRADVGAVTGWADGATITFSEEGIATPICVIEPDPDLPATCATSSFPVGAHVVRATYSGNALSSGSQSDPVTVNITPDVVEVTGVGVALTTFYPYKDGYRDTVAVRGTRSEPIGVTIKIYSPTGRTVKSATMPRASGAYSVAWNGRTSSGTMLAAGKYKVVQTLTDAFGTTKKVTSYVTLSAKRLYYTTTYITKLGSSYSSKGTYGSGKVVISTSGGYAKLVAPGAYWSNWAAVGYQFTLPSATVYKSLAFQVYMQGLWSGPNHIEMQNFSLCPLVAGAWDAACFDHAGGLGTYTSAKTWLSTTGSPTLNRSGRTVRGIASVVAGTYYIYKARVKVTYGVLR